MQGEESCRRVTPARGPMPQSARHPPLSASLAAHSSGTCSSSPLSTLSMNSPIGIDSSFFLLRITSSRCLLNSSRALRPLAVMR